MPCTELPRPTGRPSCLVPIGLRLRCPRTLARPPTSPKTASSDRASCPQISRSAVREDSALTSQRIRSRPSSSSGTATGASRRRHCTGRTAAPSSPAHLSAPPHKNSRRIRGCCSTLTGVARVEASTNRWLAPHLLRTADLHKNIALRSAVLADTIASSRRRRREENESAESDLDRAHTTRPAPTSFRVPKARRASHRSSCQQAGPPTTPRRLQTLLLLAPGSMMRRRSGRSRSLPVLRGVRCEWSWPPQANTPSAVGSPHHWKIPGRGCRFVARELGRYRRMQGGGGSAVALLSELSVECSD